MKINTEIKEAILKDKLIFFVGSGFSKEFGFPDWKSLLSIVLEELSEDYDKCIILKQNLDADIMDVLEILEKLEKMDLKLKVLENLDKIFSLKNSQIEELKQHPSKHKKMIEISSKIITTNYDQLIETANPDLTKVTYLNDFRVAKLDEYNKFIFKLHGCTEDPSKCILFRKDYETLYESESAAINELKKMISNHTVIFLGFSLNDEYVKRQFDFINNLYKGLKGKHFLITTKNESHQNISGIESIILNQWEEMDDYFDELLKVKQSVSSQVTNNLNMKNLTKEVTIKSHETNPKVCILVAEPLNKDCLFDKNHILKGFKNYSLDITYEILSNIKLNNIEEFDYLFIFTEIYNNKILIEDEYMMSKYITLRKLEEELFQENLKGIYIFSKNRVPIESDFELNNPIVVNHFDAKNFNSHIFKLLRKSLVKIDEQTILFNPQRLIIPSISKGENKHIQKHSVLSMGIDPKNLINFVGRISDLEAITRKCLDLDGRVFSIKASGGIGKTTIVKKMAIELAKRNLYKDGISFIDCEHIEDFKNFEFKITQCFEIENTINLVEYLQQNSLKKDLLLILDNFESLLYLKNEEDVIQIKNLISIICDYSSIVITTRELLEVEYEEYYELRHLTTDEAELLFKKYYSTLITEGDKKVLRESILENLLNNNPLAIKIVTGNIPHGKGLEDLQKDLEKDFFDATTQVNYENIFDEKIDINIERSKSLFNSINYSYSKLPRKEKLVFELLALFPDGIDMNNFKAFFSSDAFKKDANRVTDKEIKSLENKSLIQISNERMKLQSIVGRFANSKFNERNEEEKTPFYNRTFEYNRFVLETLERYFDKHDKNFNWLFKNIDKHINNFIETLKYIEFVEFEKYETLNYIQKVCHHILMLEMPPVTRILENIQPLYKDIENGALLIEVIILRSRYYNGEFEEVLRILNKMLPLEDVFDYYEKGESYSEKVINQIIFDYLTDIYAYKKELKVLQLAMEKKVPLRTFELSTILFKLGKIDEYEEVFDIEKGSFFNFELSFNKCDLNLEKLQYYIDDQYAKTYTEIMQLNYIKAKMGAIKKREVIELVPTNPYTKGLKNLMLAFLEKDIEKAYKLYKLSLMDLKHINYYYLEAMYYLTLFLKNNDHEDYLKWYYEGREQSEINGYNYLLEKYIALNENEINTSINFTTPKEMLLKEYFEEVILPSLEKK